jgi:hypothetical protein
MPAKSAEERAADTRRRRRGWDIIARVHPRESGRRAVLDR